MGSFPSWFRAATLVRPRASVFAVGRRVYVASAGDGLAHVALTDDAGADARTRLTDGTEVEILAWRPRKFDGTRYRVRVTREGFEGWLCGGQLTEHTQLPSRHPWSLRRPQSPCARWTPGMPGVGSASAQADDGAIGEPDREEPMTSARIGYRPVGKGAAPMTASEKTVMTERARAEETVRAIVEELDRPTLALLYKTLHDALGFRIETADIAIGKLRR
jgi:hypothetical protein